MGELKIIKQFCNNCLNDTNHEICDSENVRIKREDFDLEKIYMIVKCSGCRMFSFRKETHDHEIQYPDENDDWIHDIYIDVYPKPFNHKIITGVYLLPSKIKITYNETIDALKAGCKILVAVGFRAIIEAICIENNITGRSLEKK